MEFEKEIAELISFGDSIFYGTIFYFDNGSGRSGPTFGRLKNNIIAEIDTIA